MFASRRRRRHLPVLLLVGALASIPAIASVLAPTTVPAGAAEEGARADSGVVAAAGAGATDPEDAAAADVAGEPAAATPLFATLDGLALHLPSVDTLLVGFHEASQREALGLVPYGRLLENANTTRITPPADVTDGADYVILSSRGRRPPPTSAVDLVMRDDDPVRSPVTGVVTDVREYYLYGKHVDHRVEIRPDGHPDLRVVLIHVADVAVAVGDAVEAGETVLAGTANRFPFGSHIDRYLGERWPHVHVEVKGAEAG